MPFSYSALQQQHHAAAHHHQQHPHVPFPSSSPPLSLVPPPSPSPLQSPLTPLATPSTAKAFNHWPTPSSNHGLTSPLHSSNSSSNHPPLSNHLHHLTLNGVTAASQAQSQTLVSASAYSTHLQGLEAHAGAMPASMLQLLYPQLGQAAPASASSTSLSSHQQQQLSSPLIASLLQRHAQQQHTWQQQQQLPPHTPLHPHPSLPHSLAHPSLSFLLPNSSLLSTSTSSPSDHPSSTFPQLPMSPSSRSLMPLTTSPINQALPTPTSSTSSSSSSTPSTADSISALVRRAETAEQQRDAALTIIQQAVSLLRSPPSSATAASAASPAPLSPQHASVLQMLSDFLSVAAPLLPAVSADAGGLLFHSSSSSNLSQASGIGLKRRIPSAFHPVPGLSSSHQRTTSRDSADGRLTPPDTSSSKTTKDIPTRRDSGKRKKRRRSAGHRPSSDSDSGSGGEDEGEASKQAQQRGDASSSSGEEDDDDEEASAADGPTATARASTSVASPPNVLSRLTLKKKRDRSCLPCPLIHHVNKTPIRVVDVHIEREYTLSKRDAAALGREEKATLVKVGVRFLAPSASSTEVYVVAKDICLLIHTRKGNVAKSIGQFRVGEKARMAVICPRSDGTVSTHVLTVLSISGVRRLLAGSRSRVVGKVRGWMYHQLLTMNHPEAVLFNEQDTTQPTSTATAPAPPTTQAGAEDSTAAPITAEPAVQQQPPQLLRTAKSDDVDPKPAPVEPLSSTSSSSSPSSSAGDASDERLHAVSSALKRTSPTVASAFSALRGLTRASFSSLPTIPSTSSLSSSLSAPSSPSPPASHENSPKCPSTFSFPSLTSSSSAPAISAASGY